MPDAINLGSVYGSAELRTDNLRSGVTQTVAVLNQLEQNTKGILDRLNKNAENQAARAAAAAKRQAEAAVQAQQRAAAVTAGVLGAGFAYLGKQVLDTTVRFDSLKRGLTAVSGSAEEAERQMARLREVAKLPGLGMEEAIQGSIRLQAAGMSAMMAERSLRAFGNAIATVGGGKAQLAEVTLALQQLSNRTSGFGQEIRQLQNALPQIRQMMIAAFGTADSEKLGRSGITGAQFIEKILPAFEKLPQVVGGAQNSMENFQDASKRAMVALGDVLLPHVTAAIDKAADALQAFADEWKKVPSDVQAAILGAAGIVATVGLGTVAIGRMKDALIGLRAMAASPITLTLVVAGADWLILRKLFSQTSEPLPVGNLRPKGGPFQVFRDDAEAQMAIQAAQERDAAERARRNQAIGRGIGDAEEQRALRAVRIRPIPITSQGRYVQVQQQLIAITAQIEELEKKAQSAANNIERNLLGGQILNLKAQESRLQDQLDKFDPNKQQQAREQARREAEKNAEDLKRASQGLTRDLERSTLDRYEFDRREAKREYQDNLASTNDRTRAWALYQRRLTEINRAEAVERSKANLDALGAELAQTSQMIEQAVQNRKEADEQAFQLMKDMAAGNQTEMEQQREQIENAKKTRDEFDALARVTDGVTQAVRGLGGAMGNLFTDARRQHIDEGWSKFFKDLGRGLESIKKEGGFKEHFQKQFDFMKDFAGNLAGEFTDEFGKGLERALGKNPFSRALSRSLERLMDNTLDAFFSSAFKIRGSGATGNGIMPGDQPVPGVGLGGALIPLLLGGLFGGGGGGILGGLFKGVGGLFKGIGHIFGFAEGGIAPAGRIAMVGERGPELIMPAADTRVVPMNGTGGITINLHGVTVAGDYDVDRLIDRISTRTKQRLAVRVGA